MTTPTPLGVGPSIAIGAPFGRVDCSTSTDGRATVILHRLTGEKDREHYGPRELRDDTCAALEKTGWPARWGLGGVCVEMEDAANFAIAGYTWFTFDLSPHLFPFADEATLDTLDTRIVALEDIGCYPLGWHEKHLADGIDEETLARAAVKFGAALTHAEQLQQTLRTAWSGRGDLPDIEISLARALRRTTASELRFLTTELKRRGIHANVVAPCLGPDFQAGLQAEVPPDIDGFAEILGSIRLAAPGASHTDQSETAFFSALRHIAGSDAPFFRELLLAARDTFPVVRGDWHLSVAEDEIHMMPQPDDDALASTFLDHPQGRQLLISTWDAVCETHGDCIRRALRL